MRNHERNNIEINETSKIFETNKMEAVELLLLAQLKFRDLAAYRRYQAQFFEVMRPFRGRLLVADEAPRHSRANGRPTRSC